MILPPTRAHPSGGGSGSGSGSVNGNGQDTESGIGMSNGARQAAEDADKEDQCAVCLIDLPDTGRGILLCVSFGDLHTYARLGAGINASLSGG